MYLHICTVGVSPSGVKATISRVVEDLKFKISEGSEQNWCFPDSAHLAVSAKLRQLSGQGHFEVLNRSNAVSICA